MCLLDIRVLVDVFLLYVSSLVVADAAKCRNDANVAVHFDKIHENYNNNSIREDILGRYTLRICVPETLDTLEWDIRLFYYDNLNESECADFPTQGSPKHSSKKNDFVKRDSSNASLPCQYQTFDLIMGGCYKIYIILTLNEPSPIYCTSMHYIHNNLTKEQILSSGNNAEVIKNGAEKNATLTWVSEVIPIEKYDISMCFRDDTNCTAVTSCQSKSTYSVECPIERVFGQHKLIFKHKMPWVDGMFYEKRVCHIFYNETLNDESGVIVTARLGNWYASEPIIWSVGIVIIIVLLIVGVATFRSKRREKLSKLNSNSSGQDQDECPIISVDDGSPTILLLYASDIDLEGKALYKFLASHITDVNVIDLHSRSVINAYAGDPTKWIRNLLKNEKLKIVLLQSPLLAEKDRIKPRYEDNLVRFCVTQINNSLPTDNSKYNKYFVAMLPAAKELMEHFLIMTRYVLPSSADGLLHDIGYKSHCNIVCYQELCKTLCPELNDTFRNAVTNKQHENMRNI